MSNQEFQQVTTWIKQRQSIFPNSFSDERISNDLILAILKNANQAPTHKQTEPWRFKIITPENLEAFADFCQSAYKEYYTEAEYVERKYKKIKSKILASSHILIISMQRDKDAIIPEWEEIAAVACAVQNIYLSLKPAGLGGYWSTAKFVIEKIGGYLNFEDGERCLGLFYLGQPKDLIPPPVEKRPIEDKIQWH